MISKKKIVAILLAGGKGKRMNSDTQKQYMLLDGRPVLYYSLKALEESSVSEIILVVGAGEIEYCREQIVESYGFQKVTNIVEGGSERYLSVLQGLNAITEADYVYVHDGARPFINKEILDRCEECVVETGACIVGMPVKDTIKIADDLGFVKETPKRSSLWMVQTPQCFSFELIKKAYHDLMSLDENKRMELQITDDSMVVELFGEGSIKFLEGSYENIKITTPDDLILAMQILKK